jgi:hypothetical protein
MTEFILADPQPTTRAKNRGARMLKAPRIVDIDVYLQPPGSNPPYTLDSTLPIKNGNLSFKNNGHPGLIVNFHLHDELNPGYTFPDSAHLRDGVWSELGPNCPTSGIWDVFQPLSVENDGMTLQAYNENPTQANGKGLGEFHFTLNVTKTGGPPYLALDPGGDDQNGSRK